MTASDEGGLRFGMMTALQLLDLYNGADLPTVRITDWPDLINRGFMLDISRDKVGVYAMCCSRRLTPCIPPQVPTIDTLHELVDLIELLKYNQLQLYMEHTFQYSEHR